METLGRTEMEHVETGLAEDHGLRSPLKRMLTMPHTLLLLVILVVIAGALTHLIGAGEFNRMKDGAGRMIIVPGTFHPVKANPLPLYEVPLKLFKGIMKAADVVFFIIVIGGTFEIITRTGMLNAFTGRMARGLKGHEGWVVPIFLAAFSVGGFTMGMSTEVLVFIPIGIMMAKSLGFDVMTGSAMILLGAHAGFTAGLMNPFGVGIAQAVAQVPIFSGMWLRALLLVVLLAVTSFYILRYANRVKSDPGRDILKDLSELHDQANAKAETHTLKFFHYAVLGIVLLCLVCLLYGVTVRKWWIDEMAALFLAMGILCGVVAGYTPNRIARHFVDGARGIVFGALVVGFARSIIVVFEDGRIVDAIVFHLSNSIGLFPHFLQPIGMYLVNIVISLVIVSGSGMAMATMPVMGPVADLLGISRQTAVLMFQCADGMTHLILPTSAATMGALAAARIPFERWIKWVMPLFLTWIVIGAAFVLAACAIGYR
jgi:uncharacterized ion transporter superfamily protein YfcC